MPDLKAIRETLSKFYLTNNLITDFDGEVCSGSLEELYIGRNKLTSIKSSTFDSCTALRILSLNSNQLTVLGKVPLPPPASIAIQHNPLICDSCLLWLKDAEEYGVTIRNFTCNGPHYLQGRRFSDVTREELLPLGKFRPVYDISGCIQRLTSMTF